MTEPASDASESEETEKPQRVACVYCKGSIYFELVVTGEWAHWHGDHWCHDAGGYTAKPLRAATPTYHDNEDVL
jgi:hypothetical protein